MAFVFLLLLLMCRDKIMTSMTIKIDSNILAQAKIYGEVESRSAIEQIEYWKDFAR